MVKECNGKQPRIDPKAQVAETAVLIGDVTLEAQANSWYGAVLRGDFAPIRIGAGSNVQDNAVLHSDLNTPVTLGKGVTVGHGAILHGCTVEDNCLIGMGSVLLDGCVIGADSVVAAGCLVTRHTVVPPGSLVVGSPAKVKRPTTPQEQAATQMNAAYYCGVAEEQL